MATVSLDDAVAPPEPPVEPDNSGPTQFSLASVVAPQPQSVSLDQATGVPSEGPMPGSFRALAQGIQAGWERGKQSIAAVEGQQPEATQPETSPAAQPVELSDLWSLNVLPKTAYQLGKSFPTAAAGVAGTAAGTAMAGPVGGLVGGTAGAAVGAAFQEVGPLFVEELKKSPSDPDGAWNRALHEAEVSGAFSGASWLAFGGINPFKGALKNMAFQVLGIQPGIAATEQATQNIAAGKPLTENVGQAAAQGAIGTAIPMAGHALVRAISKPTVDPSLGHQPNFTGEEIGPKDQAGNIVQGIEPIYKELNMTPPTPQQASNSFVGRQMQKIVGVFQRNFSPGSINDASLQAEGIHRWYGSKTASEQDSIYHSMMDARMAAEKWLADVKKAGGDPDLEAFKFIDYAEGKGPPGWKPPDELMPHLALAKKLMPWIHDADQQVGFDYGDRGDDYFPRQYEARDRQRAQQFFQQRVNMQQPDFQKPRTLDLAMDAHAMGMKLVSPNPFDIISNRLMASAEARARIGMLGRMNEAGLGQPVDLPGDVARAQSAGWNIIKAPNARQWALHPDTMDQWNTLMNGRGLWSDPTIMGDMFKKWMALKNTYVPVKLGLSAFHPLHVSHINFVNGMTQAWAENPITHPIRAFNAIAKGIYGQATEMRPGSKTQLARKAWLTPEWDRTPEQKAIVNTMNEAGFSPQLSEELRVKATENFRKAVAQGNYASAIPRGLWNNTFGLIQKGVFEHWIPSLKTHAFLQAVESFARKRPDIMQNDILRRAATGAIAKSIDNRFGEMFYKNLHWNKMIKDIGIGSMLSLGWNVGGVREGVGGILEPFLRNAVLTPTQEAVYAAKNKFAFTFAYAATAMALNGLMTSYMTGQSPDGMDYFLPRIGGTNPDGSPRRITNMFYTREVPMLQKHIEEQQSYLGGLRDMIWNKTLLEPFKEYYSNRDYYGFEIMNPNSPWYQQAWQMTKFVLGDQFDPITLTGAKRALQAQGQWDNSGTVGAAWNNAKTIMQSPDAGRAFLGFSPAPTYASRTETINRLNYLFQHYVAPELRPQAEKETMEARYAARQDYNAAKQSGDQERIAKAARELKAAGQKFVQQPEKQMFTRLPWSAQVEFLSELNKEDFKHYYLWANKNAKADRDIIALRNRYYNQ